MENLKNMPTSLKTNIRTFLDKTFTMKVLQREFQDLLAESLKPSLQKRVKFEIAEERILNSRSFAFLRLHFIKCFYEEIEEMKRFNPDDPALLKMTPTKCATDYKNMVFELLNSLEIEHYIPGDSVII